MLELGGNIYFTAKLGATDGHSFQHLAALMTGSTQEDYAEMMLARRPLGRRQPLKSGQHKKPDDASRQGREAKAENPQQSERSTVAKIIAGVASSHVPAIGAAIDNQRTEEPYWKRVF